MWLNSVQTQKQRAKSGCRVRAGKINKPAGEKNYAEEK